MSSLFKRQEFPMLQRALHGKPLVYLDSAATSLKPSYVIDAMSDFYSSSYATVHRGAYELSLEATERYNLVREQVKRFINASSLEEVVFTSGATDGINLIARSYGNMSVNRGDEIVISLQEHHSNIVPWQLLCERKGAHLKVIPLLSDGQIDLERFEQLLTDRTKIVSVAHISNVLGMINPIHKITSAAHRVGAKVVVDAAQSAPHLALDVQALQCDFLVFSAHKLYGPTGVGVLFGKKQLLEQMPPDQGGGGMVQTVSFEKTTYQDPPLRFEAGTPMIAEVIGLGAAIDYINSYSLAAIGKYESELIQFAVKNLPEETVILGSKKNKTSLLSFYIPGVHSFDLATLLGVQGICVRSGFLCAEPLLRHFGLTSALRVSIAPYNTLGEISLFCETLDRLYQPK